MKNFKKVLALVLVLATLMGLATVAGAAYTDASEISADYTEATKVLELIETMEGYPDGSFGPKKTITREEAAKLIAIFDNKDADIETYYTSINPFADEKGRWGESYVGYCYRAGIVGGRNANTFDPTANVTGTEFLKMVLVTLGYDAEAEGFVGSSWAVNVLSLAKQLGLVANLASGWKAEAALTREEAAQIMLDALNTYTVEYGSAVKAYFNNDSFDADLKDFGTGAWYFQFNGRLYATVAGAVTTGNYLYESFDLVKDTTTSDAFYRPTTTWKLGKDSVEVMWVPEATFTTEFNACDLFVALGIEETDTKTKIEFENYYVNGKLIKTFDTEYSHTVSKCDLKENNDLVFGAQGTLTQIFYMGKNTSGNKIYRICSIDTWLAKVNKVSTYTTSRDGHKKGSELVNLTFYQNDASETIKVVYANNPGYIGEINNCPDTANGGKWETVFDDPTGLTKGDYVLATFSSKTGDVETVELVEAKEGRLNGFKLNDVANVSETRIDGTYVTDSQHFHLGYEDSKTEANFGTWAFFYDNYGNVIGMIDGADTSKYAVLDKVYVEYTDGVAALYADVVDFNGNVTKKAVIENIELDDENGYTHNWADFVALRGDLGGMNFKDYMSYNAYDNVLSASTNTKGEYDFDSVEKAKTVDGKDVDGKVVVDGSVTILAGKPFFTVGSTQTVKTTAETQYLIRTGDVGTGSYVPYTGYKNVKSLKATHAEYVLDDDGYAVAVYLCGDVVFTDGKVVAWVPGNATTWNEEVEDDGAHYFILKVYVDGVVDYLKITAADADTIDVLNEESGNFVEFQYVDIDEVTTAKVVSDWDGKLKTQYTVVDFYDDYALEITTTFGSTGENKMALADDCVVYSIRDNGEVVKEDVAYADKILEAGRSVHVNWSDDNEYDVNMITALYVVESADAPWFD